MMIYDMLLCEMQVLCHLTIFYGPIYVKKAIGIGLGADVGIKWSKN